jgi:hypothetical protein
MGWLKAVSCCYSALGAEGECFLSLSQYMTVNWQIFQKQRALPVAAAEGCVRLRSSREIRQRGVSG